LGVDELISINIEIHDDEDLSNLLGVIESFAYSDLVHTLLLKVFEANE